MSGVIDRTVRSLDLSTLSDVSLTEKSGGSGIITFGPRTPSAGNAPRPWPGSPETGPQFELPADSRAVYEEIRRTIAAGR